MNLKFLPFFFAAFISTAANAETFDEVTTESLKTNDAYIYGNMELNNNRTGLTINLPRAAENYSNFIECKNNNIAVYNRMFLVDPSGTVTSTGLVVRDQSADNCCSPKFGIGYDNNNVLSTSENVSGFIFNTSSYPGGSGEKYYPMVFKANQFIYDKGDMVVNGSITCKKETVLDSALSVNDNAAFHKNINVSGKANLSTLNIDIPYTSDKSGQKTRSYDYLIKCTDAATASYNTMFTVDWNGNVNAKGLTLRDGTAINTPYSSTLKMYFDKESNSFVFNTSGYEGSPYERHNTLTFDAGNYIFNRGDMVVNGNITCKKETVLDSALSVNDNATFHKNINVSGETNLSTLNINNPFTSDTSGQKTRSYNYLIKCTDAATDSSSAMFAVDWSGNVNAKGLTLRDGIAIATPDSSTLNMYFDKESNSFVFGSDERRNSLTFDADNYIFKGDMVVNGKIICKNETVFDSVLSVNDNAAFHKNINVSGETSLSTLNINIPCTSDINGQKKRSYDYLIKCTDAATDSSKNMFTVDWSGNVNAKGLNLREGIAIETPDSSTLNMYFDKESNSFVFNTAGNEGSSNERRNSLTFDADNYMFNKGDMVVNGKITCKNEINVTSLNANDVNVKMNNVADYVFDEGYNLKSLSEVESFVKENKHLPGIPSAAEIEQNGVSLSQMSNMLLEKVEELTLHLIRLEKENAELKAKFESMEK